MFIMIFYHRLFYNLNKIKRNKNLNIIYNRIWYKFELMYSKFDVRHVKLSMKINTK